MADSPAATPPLDDMPEAADDAGDVKSPDTEQEGSPNAAADSDFDKDDESDLESALSDVDERQFEDFDPTAIAIEDRPAIAVDETTVGHLGKHKRKRVEGEDEERRKKKEKRREKPKKSRRRREGTEEFEGGDTIEGSRQRKSKRDGESSRRRIHDDDDGLSLSPEERRKRALDRKIDDVLKLQHRRALGKKDGMDLEQYADKEIERMRDRMILACQEDGARRLKGLPGMKKLELLPEVKNLLNRTQLATQLVDPEINLLEAVKFFLEPLNPDGVLPAYSIQRELFAALAKLPITKQSLIASGIGKVVLFYTKSRQPEYNIKIQAEKLLSEWMRPILKRSDDYRKRELATATYDPSRLALRPNSNSQASPTSSQSNAARDAALARPDQVTNRARVQGGLGVYTVVPKSNINQMLPVARAPGQSGEEAFRRMKARQQGKIGGGGGRSRG